MSPTSLLLRCCLALAGLAVGLVVVEAGLRGSYPTLPSLAALHDRPDLLEPFRVAEGQRFRDDRVCDQVVRQPRGRDVSFGSGEPTRTVWFAGDSMTAGMGVELGEAWPEQLGQRMQAQLGGRVVLRNLALPGVGYCEVLRRVHSELQFGQPDVVVVGLFADDLETRALLARDGQLVGLPHTIPSPTLRWLARRSYAANLAWFAVHSRPDGPVRFIDGPGRRAFQDNLVALTAAIREAGATPLVALIEPVGAANCGQPGAAEAAPRCTWMPDDLALMADLLDEAGVSYLDTRGVWEALGATAIPEEAGQPLPIHPDAASHARFAEWLLVEVGPILSGGRHPTGEGDLAELR